jgi:hypothetical protein
MAVSFFYNIPQTAGESAVKGTYRGGRKHAIIDDLTTLPEENPDNLPSSNRFKVTVEMAMAQTFVLKYAMVFSRPSVS